MEPPYVDCLHVEHARPTKVKERQMGPTKYALLLLVGVCVGEAVWVWVQVWQHRCHRRKGDLHSL